MLKVSVFAQLKEYFNAGIELPATAGQTVSQVLEQLKHTNPDAAPILDSSRVAVNDEMVDLKHIIEGNEHIYIFPPSSGG